ncbi:Rha family transcriptional regulator [Edwardsiella tarda]|uniref:Rha family phage regulatory protein n=1 Tax=Edwardsiella tarda TaxID=636 RepID=UPI003A875352
MSIDNLYSGRYTEKAVAKSAAGRGNPELITAHDRALAVFLCAMHCYTQFMVGRAGQLLCWPVSVVTGISTPARLTTNQVVESLGGELKKLTIEVAIMATIPAIAHPEITVINGQAVTSSLFDYLKLLRLAGVPGYIRSVAVNPATGFDSLKLTNAHSRTSGFFVCNARTHLNYGGLSGGAARLAGIVGSRSVNPAQVTTSCLTAARGGYKNLSNGAVAMTTLPTEVTPEIQVINGQAVTSSLAIAAYFHKPHKDVLSKISRLDCSVEFTERNFSLSEYTDTSGRRLPCYQITRDGFAFLAMGFTGKRAAQFKESYITAFNQMEKQLYSAVGPSASDAQRAQVVYFYLTEINRVWKGQLYPMLVAAQSPLASSLHDYINDGAFAAALLNASMNRVAKEVV